MDHRPTTDHSHARPRSRAAFTLIEILVIIGIIGVLIGLILPALSGASTRMRKLTEQNRLRQVGLAWSQYANMHRDAALPGYLTTAAQQEWRVAYRYPDGSKVMPAPDYPPEIPGTQWENTAGQWPWRLLPFLDYDPGVVLGHRETGDLDLFALKDRAWEIRSQPAFSYNGLFIGGWWWDKHRFFLHNSVRVWDAASDEVTRALLVSRTTSSVRRASSVITFTTAAARLPGVYSYNAGRDDEDGNHTAVPPIFAMFRLWGDPLSVDPSPSIIEAFNGVYATTKDPPPDT